MSPGMCSPSQSHPQLQQSVAQLHREDRDRALLLVLPGQFSCINRVTSKQVAISARQSKVGQLWGISVSQKGHSSSTVEDREC